MPSRTFDTNVASFLACTNKNVVKSFRVEDDLCKGSKGQVK